MGKKTDEQLAELLLRWEEAWEQGRDVPAAALCVDCPQLLDEVQVRINDLKSMNWMGQSVEDAISPDVAAAQAIPDTLAGRYRVETLIAEGGFGRVYRGYDPELQRPVAIKIPRPHRVTTNAQTDALLEEARKAAKLRCQGIVFVYDVGRHDGITFIISDLIEGSNLADLMARQRPDMVASVKLVAEVAEHLHYAHEQGFIHRDIKPANILIDQGGKPFITDFGIATSREELLRSRNAATGTLPYMSPEQVAGEIQLIGARTDVYALGVVLYELLTGKLPYTARTPTALREQILFRAPVSLRSISPLIPTQLEQVCLKCLAKHPTDRHGSAQELANELHHWLDRASNKGPRAWKAIGFLVVMLTVALGLTLPWWRNAEPTEHGTQPAGKSFVKDGAFYFDGRTRIITPLERFAPCTLEAWIKLEKYKTDGVQAVIGSDIPGQHGLGLGMTSVVPWCEFITGQIKGKQAIPLGEWTHLAVVLGEQETRLYMNGKLVDVGPPTQRHGGTPFVIGNVGRDHATDYFHGHVRSVRITAGELYQSEFHPTDLSTRHDRGTNCTIKLLYNAENVQNNKAVDISGNGMHGYVK